MEERKGNYVKIEGDINLEKETVRIGGMGRGKGIYLPLSVRETLCTHFQCDEKDLHKKLNGKIWFVTAPEISRFEFYLIVPIGGDDLGEHS